MNRAVDCLHGFLQVDYRFCLTWCPFFSGEVHTIQQGDDQKTDQDGKADYHDGRAFLLFHCVSAALWAYPGKFIQRVSGSEKRRSFPVRYRGLTQKATTGTSDL